MRGICRGLAGLALLLPLWANTAQAQVCGSNGTFNNLEVVGLTADQRLICFRENTPATPRAIGSVTGLQGGEKLVDLDFRPANGNLTGLGSAGGVYTINPATGAATRVTTLTMMGTPVALTGTTIGVDFNPVPDRLRVVTNSGQDLRVNVDTGETIIDGVLAAPAAPGAQPVANTGVTAAAYTNNDAAATTGTVLYDLDTTADQLLIQAPPNAGTINVVGALGTDFAVNASLDIFTRLATGNQPQAIRVLGTSAPATGASTLFRIDTLTGLATTVAPFATTDRVIGIAIPLTQTGTN